ncbi:MAG: helix-turn-helix transcriptional regulator [Eubacteriales bacterium]|nr:helix-turn-helix transcriptional regulator [Eubacteriales bacterium]
MTLLLGEKIKYLRKRDGRTQEELAAVLGITCQAVSRWESGASYPDMELIPPIANYFGITIDELFGYECEREKKVDGIIARIGAYQSDKYTGAALPKLRGIRKSRRIRQPHAGAQTLPGDNAGVGGGRQG